MQETIIRQPAAGAPVDLEVTKRAIKNDRVRFGLGTILYQSEELGLGPVPTAIVRFLGGDDRQIGMLTSLNVLNSVGHLFGNTFLRWKKSNRKAMIATMKVGAFVAGLIVLLLLLGKIPQVRPLVLAGYIAMSILFTMVSGLQVNIDTNWIGDLVPEALRGWFTKIKWILSVIGIIFFTIFLARIADYFPTLGGYASIYGIFAVSFIVAAFLIYPGATDREPKVANFISDGETHHERLNYLSPPLWLNICFGILWMPARVITNAFVPMYMMDQFNFSLTKIALIMTLQYAISIPVIFFVGDLSDRWGSRRPLIAATLIIGASMSLWFFSAWGGMVCVIAYMIINGASGHTLSMLGTNFQLELYPDKGRSAYMAFSRNIGLPVTFATTFFSGYLVHNLAEVHITFLGTVLTRYHLIFLCTTILGLISAIPLLMVGNRRVTPL